MAAIITPTLKTFFINKIFDDIGDSNQRYYLGIGESQDWDSTDTPPIPRSHEREERNFRLKMQSMKKVAAHSFVVPRNNWTAGTTYDAYSDDLDAYPTNAYYVLTDENKVFICLQQAKNAQGAPVASSVKPTGEESRPFETSDGYVWKYLYTISALRASQFVTSNFIPVQKLDELDSGASVIDTLNKEIQDSAVPGEIVGIKLVNGGTGYTGTPTVSINGRFRNGKTDAHSDNKTALATATISGGAIVKIEMNDSGSGAKAGKAFGRNYDFAQVTFSGGGGANAKAQAIIARDSGISGDPRRALRSTAIMFNTKIEGTENKKFLVNQDFRQVGLIKNPVDMALDSFGARAFGSFPNLSENGLRGLKFTTITANFTRDNTILGLTSGAKAYIDQFDSSVIKYHQDETTGFLEFLEGETIDEVNGNGSGTLMPAGADADSAAFTESGIDITSGEILYIDNRASITRDTEQTEDLKVVVQL